MVSDKKKLTDEEFAAIFTDTERLTEILQAGIFAELLKHKKMGNSVCVWRDGKVVWIPPEQIPVSTQNS